jgi:protein-L-isoaspartate(D-aspartate) O-methyltransferase
VTHQNFDQMRHAMVVSQLRTTAVSNTRVIDAMGKVAREQFVPAERRSIAYVDIAVPLDADGRALNPAMVTGRLLTAVDPQPGEKILLIGAATGYAAALLSAMGCTVVAVESDATLHGLASAALANEAHVTVVAGPMEAGAPTSAPYDVLIIDGAVEQLPPALADQLADGGRIAFGVRDGAVTRLSSGIKVAGTVSAVPFTDVAVVALPGFAAPAGFRF